jgi:hypothetical protein
VLRDPRSSKSTKTLAGAAFSVRAQVMKGGVAYIVRNNRIDSTLVTSARSVQTIKQGAAKYSKALRRFAKK